MKYTIPDGTIHSTNRGNYPRPLWQTPAPQNYRQWERVKDGST